MYVAYLFYKYLLRHKKCFLILYNKNLIFITKFKSILFFRGKCVLKCEGFWNLVNIQSRLEKGVLPQAAQRGLLKAFVLVGGALDEGQERNEYLAQVRSVVTNFTD